MFIFLISLFILSSCNNDVVFTDSIEMPDQTWKISDTPNFNVTVTDTINNNDISFIIRTGSLYPFRNIYIFVTTSAPDGKSRTDTLQYYLADEKGNWTGKGFGDIKELVLPYRTNVFFPLKGTYRFKMQHGMRIEDLKGVYDFGLRIEKTSK